LKTYHIEKFGSPDGLALRTHDDPKPEPEEVVVRMRANSLNYRDLMVIKGLYRSAPKPGLIPFSDGVGEVSAVGARVTRVKVGDRVAGIFHQRWLGGRLTRDCMGSDLGGSIDGLLTEQAVLNQEGVVLLPKHLSFEEAATLPCAAVTAWAGLVEHARVIAGDTVLTLGSGGVSVIALQLAKLLGARVISTTSSPDKAKRLKALGADEVIDYVATPDWDQEVMRLTGGRGVNCVIEVGGPGTLTKSVKSLGVGGYAVLIGRIAEGGQPFDPNLMRGTSVTLRSVSVGSRQDFEAMNRAIDLHKLRPVVDRVFPFAQAKEAYRYLEDRKHFGKIVISYA
jgi:NADPH:quinone reductase-like Zn-dependent oxidoreductase